MPVKVLQIEPTPNGGGLAGAPTLDPGSVAALSLSSSATAVRSCRSQAGRPAATQ
jgi:hypothetical protein